MKKSTASAPLFIPLRREFFDMFREGTKVAELRKHGPRWNETTCWVGRDVVLSCGYGKAHRLTGVIAGVAVVAIEQLGTEDRHQFLQCCGYAPHVIVITIGNLQDPQRETRSAMRQSVEPVRRFIIRKHALPEDTQITSIEFAPVGAPPGEMRVVTQRAATFTRGPLEGEPDWSRAIGSPVAYYLTPEERKALRDHN